MGPLLQEVAAINLILAHLLSRMPQDELRELSENISNQLQQFGDGKESMAIYRAKIDEIISNAANLSQ